MSAAGGQSKGLVVLDMDDPYVTALIKEEFATRASQWDLVHPAATIAPSDEDAKTGARADPDEIEAAIAAVVNEAVREGRPVFQWGEYERVNWDLVQSGKQSTVWYMNVRTSVRATRPPLETHQ